MNLDLRNKRALVCGSTQGIGKAAAMELSSLGAEVVLLARNEEKLKNTLKELHTHYEQKHSYLVADFGHAQQLQDVISEFASKTSIHILVNNTGGPDPGMAIDAEIEQFRIAFNNHLICNHILVKALVGGMKSEQYGRIINVISTSVKQPLPNLGVSNTVRAAVSNWAKTLANELGQYGITVNNVLPGATLTGRLEGIIQNKSSITGKSVNEIEMDMIKEIPAKRLGQASDIASVIAFLASPAAAYINGINLPVDGGRTACL